MENAGRVGACGEHPIKVSVSAAKRTSRSSRDLEGFWHRQRAKMLLIWRIDEDSVGTLTMTHILSYIMIIYIYTYVYPYRITYHNISSYIIIYHHIPKCHVCLHMEKDSGFNSM
jgi:hypothetical protein